MERLGPRRRQHPLSARAGHSGRRCLAPGVEMGLWISRGQQRIRAAHHRRRPGVRRRGRPAVCAGREKRLHVLALRHRRSRLQRHRDRGTRRAAANRQAQAAEIQARTRTHRRSPRRAEAAERGFLRRRQGHRIRLGCRAGHAAVEDSTRVPAHGAHSGCARRIPRSPLRHRGFERAGRRPGCGVLVLHLPGQRRLPGHRHRPRRLENLSGG